MIIQKLAYFILDHPVHRHQSPSRVSFDIALKRRPLGVTQTGLCLAVA